MRKPADARAYEQVTLAKAERDARVSAAEAERQEVELKAAANAQRVKLEAGAEAERVRLAASAEAEHVRLEASARAESVQAIGEAEAAATRAKGLAEGEAVHATGMAEAEAIKARADALAENQDAVIGQQLAENWPAIVEAAAKPFGGIDQLIVLNGAQGLSEALAAGPLPGRRRPPAGPQPPGPHDRRQRRRRGASAVPRQGGRARRVAAGDQLDLGQRIVGVVVGVQRRPHLPGEAGQRDAVQAGVAAARDGAGEGLVVALQDE